MTSNDPPDDPPPSLRPHYRDIIATTRRSARLPCTGTLPLTVSAACGSPLRPPTIHGRCQGEAFPRSTLAPEPSSCHLYAGLRQGSRQVSPWLIPGQQRDPGFEVVYAISTPHRWFTFVHLLGSHLTHQVRLFRNAHHHDSFTAAACGGLPPFPAERRWRTYLHHQRSITPVRSTAYAASFWRVRGTPLS